MKQYKIISQYCGTQVNNESYNEEDADVFVEKLNEEAKELGFPEVIYTKVLVGEEQ